MFWSLLVLNSFFHIDIFKIKPKILTLLGCYAAQIGN